MDAPTRTIIAPPFQVPQTRQDVIRFMVFPSYSPEVARQALANAPDLGWDPHAENPREFEAFFQLACQARGEMWGTFKQRLLPLPEQKLTASQASLVNSIAVLCFSCMRYSKEAERDDLFTFIFNLCQGKKKKISELNRLPTCLKVLFHTWCLKHVQTLSDKKLEAFPRDLVSDWPKVCYERGAPLHRVLLIPDSLDPYAQTCLRFSPETTVKMLRLSPEELRTQIFGYLHALNAVTITHLKLLIEVIRILVLGVRAEALDPNEFVRILPLIVTQYTRCLLKERPAVNVLEDMQETLAVLAGRCPEHLRENLILLKEMTEGVILTYETQNHDPLRVLLSSIVFYEQMMQGLEIQEQQEVQAILLHLRTLVVQAGVPFNDALLKNILEAPKENRALVFFAHAFQQPGCQGPNPSLFEYLQEHHPLGDQIKNYPNVCALVRENYQTHTRLYLLGREDPALQKRIAFFDAYFG